MKTKLFRTLLVAILLIPSVTSISKSFADERIEINLGGVIAPQQGYDDNDQVEVVVYGKLPNACYTLADSYAEVKDDGQTIRLYQYAYHETRGICAQDGELPSHMMLQIPFATVIPLGRLGADDYLLRFRGPEGVLDVRDLNVTASTVPTVDSMSYAAIGSIFAPEVVLPGTTFKLTLGGVLNSSCTEIDSVEVVRQEDVWVVLPILKIKENENCAQVLIPFQTTVMLTAGDKEAANLIHVRSMNGKSLNQVVYVEE